MSPNIDRLRKQIADDLHNIFFELRTVGHAQEKYLFEGEWRTRDQITELYQKLKRKDRRIFFELLIGLMAIAGFAGFMMFLLYAVCCSS